MRESVQAYVKLCISKHRAKKVFRKAVRVMGCVVAFVTTYALILPAITMEKATFCGIDEHTHTEVCYRQQVEKRELICGIGSDIHVHSAGCYHANGSVICGQADYIVHSHDSSCRNDEGVLICTLPERSSHVHGSGCYITPDPVPPHRDTCEAEVKGDLICEQEECQGHSHSGSCYQATSELICTKSPGHQHSESCYAPQLECTLSVEPHIHSAACYGTGSQICNIPENHIHQDACMEFFLACGNTDAEHQHADACYGSNIVCNTEAGHIHGSSCYERVINCGKAEGEAHAHGDLCYGSQKLLICTLEENHTHSNSCYNQELICQTAESDGHCHDDECFQWNREYVCEMEEGQLEPAEPELVCNEPQAPSHVHGESCFRTHLTDAEAICGMEHAHILTCYETICLLKEHTHSLPCYSDPDADVETPQYWESTMRHVALTGDWNRDVVAIAESQLGYTESTRNYTVWEDGSVHGYTRYGAWYGVPHGDWCGMFVSFCLRYAGVDAIPINYGVRPWIKELSRPEWNLYRTAEEYIPIPGDLVFFDWDNDKLSDHVGIVYEVTEATEFSSARLRTIEGNSSNCVRFVTYDLNSPVLLGYSMLKQTTEPNEPEMTAYYCGLEAHEHGEGCFDEGGNTVCEKEAHQHEETCLTESEPEPVYYCGLEVHEHGEGCFDEGGNTVCEKEAHQHEETCLTESEPEPVYYCGLEVHEHGEGCYDEGGNTVCEIEAHQHEETCLTESEPEPVYYCGLEAHEHGEGCYDEDGNTVCEKEAHQHEETCLTESEPEPVYYCGLEAHEHGEGCYDEDGNTICEKEVHQHGASCLAEPVYYCGLQEHTHEACCYDEAGACICQQEEHSHEASCMIPVPELTEATMYAQIYTDDTYTVLSDDDMRITVTGMLPADAEIRAYPIMLDAELQVLCAYEIEILQTDGTIFEPAEGENLNVIFQSRFLEEQDEMQVYYIPEEGEPEAVDTTVTEEGVAFDAPHFSVYAVMSTASEILEPFTNGTLSYDWNTVGDAFIYDPRFASFYNAGSPLGTAGSFHIVGFGTVTLNSHTNGNVLANTLIAINNFGTNSKNNVDLVEISYVQNYQQVNANSAADTGDYLVIGSDNVVAKTNNGHSLAINGTKMDKPNHIIHDVSTEEAPFINLDRVQAEINAISSNLYGYGTSADSVMRAVTSGSDPHLELVSPDNVGIYHISASDLRRIQGNDGWDMRGFASGRNGAIVINVDCSNADRSQPLQMPKSRVYVDGIQVPLEETLDFSAGKVIWNFVNASGLQIVTTEMTGMIIAPGATVNISSNLNGTVVAENVNVNAESHRTDFSGKVIPTEHIDGAHIHVYKVDKNNYGKFLQGARFVLYEWNGASWVVARQNSQDQIDITDGEGKVIFQNLTYNVAYRLEETQAPPGYKISTDYQYYYFEHADTRTYPVRKPAGFTETDSEDCIIHYYPNEESDVDVTSLHLEKHWQDTLGNDLHVTPWDSVQVEVTRAVSRAVLDKDGNPALDENGQVIYEEASAVSVMYTVEVFASEGWTKTLSNLPVTSDDRKEKYTYSAREVGTDDVLEPDENGIVTIINRADVTYVPLSLEKKWAEVTPDNVSEATFRLFRMYRRSDSEPWSEPEPVLEEIVLNAANGWRWDAEEHLLIKEMRYGEDVVSFAYFAVETPVPEGYYPDYHEISRETPLVPEETENSLEVTNHKIQYTDLTIVKSWQDYYGEALEEAPEESVTVQLQQSADGGTTWEAYGDPVTINKQDNWTHTLRDLPLQDEQGQPLTYRVEELPLLGYLSTGGTVGEDGNAEIVNRQIYTTSLKIRKIWQEADGSQIQLPPVDRIKIQILRSVNDGPWTPYQEPVEVTAEEGWILSMEGLPSSDPVRKETYRYTVEELEVSDSYESLVSDVTDGTITVSNIRQIEATDILVEKRWFNHNGVEFYANSGSVEVKLFQLHHPAGTSAGMASETVDVTVKLTQYGDDGSIFATNTYSVPVGTKITVSLYTYGSDSPQLFSAHPGTPWARTEVGYNTSSLEGGRKTRTFTYTVTSDVLLIGQTNHWNLAECGGQATYSAGASDGKLYDTVTLNVANGWRYLFSDLPLYTYDEMQNVTGSYLYYVEETGGSKYSATYADANGNPVSMGKPVTGGTVRVNNRIPDDTYVMPETGGAGAGMYYLAGLLLIGISLTLLLQTGKRRREVP